MPILLVRHGEAGSRSTWEGPDMQRPLTGAGHAQAQALAHILDKFAPKRLLSSPYTRCVQTLEPLAMVLGVDVEPVEELAEGRGYEAFELLREVAASDAALCTHGDVIPEILQTLAVDDGLDLGPNPRQAKGSTWVLESAGRRFIAASYLPAPA